MKLISTKQLLKNHELSSFTNASVFGALPETTILWLLQNGKIYFLAKGENLFTQGRHGDSFNVILEGQISYYKFHEDRYAYIREYKVGEQIGFMSMIALHNRVGRAEAHQDTITLEINSDLFHDFHNNAPLEFGILMMNLAREMARTLRTVDNILVEKS